MAPETSFHRHCQRYLFGDLRRPIDVAPVESLWEVLDPNRERSGDRHDRGVANAIAAATACSTTEAIVAASAGGRLPPSTRERDSASATSAFA